MMVLVARQLILSVAVQALATPHESTASSSGISSSAISHVSESARLQPEHSWQTSSDGVCDSRTVNYITHGLPQQCLRKDRVQTIASYQPKHNENITATVDHTSFSEQQHSSSASSSSASASVQPATPENPSGPATSAFVIQAHSSYQDVPSSPSAIVVTFTGTPEILKGSEANAEDSPLDTAHFLSFEEWKKQNLVKAGQSPENLAQRSDPFPNGRPRPAINNALDTLGDESEIDLDFGFGHTEPHQHLRSSSDATSAQKNSADAPSASSVSIRSKDAGKTCKERTNYASFDCAATVLKNNPECKSASSVLVEHKDSYMLNKCSAKNKFIIIELCDDILVDTVVLANYEFFSSIFRHFRVSVSDRYPVKAEKWKELGTFEARSTREIQAFLIENPLIWARFLRIEFLTHYGNEYYCPVSLLRIHGTTMMEEFKHQDEQNRGDTSDEEMVEVNVQQPHSEVATPPDQNKNEKSAHTSGVDSQKMGTMEDPKGIQHNTPEASKESFLSPSPATGTEKGGEPGVSSSVDDPLTPMSKNNSISSPSTQDICAQTQKSVKTAASSNTQHYSNASIGIDLLPTHAESHNVPTHGDDSTSTASKPVPKTTSIPKSEPATNLESSSSVKNQSTMIPSSNVESSASRANESSKPKAQAQSSASVQTSGMNSSKNSASPTVPNPNPQPSTQESFFKSVHKRLQQLESNSTLSLQYIEEQSRILRDAFSKVEKRQAVNALSFLTHLNETVMIELSNYRQAYDQLWQSTVLELEAHREQYQREMLALSSRLTIVADELLWQKRVGIFQSTLLLIVLCLVIFSRPGNNAFEVPIFQQVVNRSQAALRTGWDSDPGNSSPISNKSKELLVRKFDSPSSDNDVPTDDGQSRPQTSQGFNMHVSPPTPESTTTGSVSDDNDSDLTLEDEQPPSTRSKLVETTALESVR